MSPVRNGVQWTSRVSPRTLTLALLVAAALSLPFALHQHRPSSRPTTS